jgi:hypothetical protein
VLKLLSILNINERTDQTMRDSHNGEMRTHHDRLRMDDEENDVGAAERSCQEAYVLRKLGEKIMKKELKSRVFSTKWKPCACSRAGLSGESL